MKNSVSLIASVAFSCLLSVSFADGLVGWNNLDDLHRLGGRKVSEGYLRGKVVLVDRFGYRCPPCRALLPRLESIWTGFKTKPFVLLGGHCEGWGSADEVKSLIKENGLSYPIYEEGHLLRGEPSFDGIPFLYVVDETGAVRYKGRDERRATEVIVTQLTNMESPKDVRMWKYYIDWEVTALPGRAFLRLEEFRKKFPKEGAEYDEIYKAYKADADIMKLAKLVAFSRIAKDYDPKSRKNKVRVTKSKIEMTIKSYEVLKDCVNPLVSQEAKNSIADLKWALLNF